MTTYTKGDLDVSAARFAVVVSRFNKPVTEGLLTGAVEALQGHGAKNVDIYWCPGAFEIPLVAKRLAARGGLDAIICLGAVIKGQTYHFEVISDSVVRAIQQVVLDTGVPVALGILTPLTASQALERADPEGANKGAEAALAAMEMVHLMQQIGK